MAAPKNLKPGFCRYHLDVGLEHFYTGQRDRFATPLHCGSEDAAGDLAMCFAFYNGRQANEVDVKEDKGVFALCHLSVRTAAGLAIQEEFTVLASNLVRWAAVWLQEQPSPLFALFNQKPASIKEVVRIAASTSAVVFRQPEGNLLLRFDEPSPLPDSSLGLGKPERFS